LGGKKNQQVNGFRSFIGGGDPGSAMPKKGGKGGKDDKGKGKGKDEPPDVSVQVCRVSWCCA
jgi:hypothetical protein